MSILKRLFGGGSGGGGASGDAPPEEHGDYRIYPAPVKEGSRWRVAARIEKDADGETRVHQLVRADTFEDEQTATAESLAKARMMIDQQGDRIFG